MVTVVTVREVVLNFDIFYALVCGVGAVLPSEMVPPCALCPTCSLCKTLG